MARAHNQAHKFGVETAIPNEAETLDEANLPTGPGFVLGLQRGESIRAHAVVIATGAQYRELDVENVGEFVGTSVHYWASPLERRLCSGSEVGLIGAGNSAGQAAVYLAAQAAKVSMIVRGASLEATMSKYLCARIRALPNVEVLVQTEVVGLQGDERCVERHSFAESNQCGRAGSSDATSVPVHRRRTEYEVACALRRRGRQPGIHPGRTLAGAGRLPFETSRAGVFAVGDVRAGSIKRVAAAVAKVRRWSQRCTSYLAQSRNASSPIVPRATEAANG